MKDLEVSGSYIKGSWSVGGVAGFNAGKIENCSTTNSIVTGKTNVGGNVGVNAGGGIISGSCINEGKVNGIDYVGGNVGENTGSIEGNCINKGLVKGDRIVGGNIGVTARVDRIGIKGKVTKNCINEEKVEGKMIVGGNVGEYMGEKIEGNWINKGLVKGDEIVGGNIAWFRTSIDGTEHINEHINIEVIGNCEENKKSLQNTGKVVEGKSEEGKNIGFYGYIDIDI